MEKSKIKNQNVRLAGKYVAGAALIGVAMLMIIPAVAYAHNIPFWPSGYWGPILSCTADGCGTGMEVCNDLCDLAHTGQHFTYLLMSIAVFVAAPVMLIWGGIMMMLAGANPANLQTGKNIITGAIMGIVIALGAFILVQFVFKIIADASGGQATGLFGSEIKCEVGKDAPIGITVVDKCPL